MGHGHVAPNPDGSKARCGGPGICADCAVETGRILSTRKEKADASDRPAGTVARTERGGSDYAQGRDGIVSQKL